MPRPGRATHARHVQRQHPCVRVRRCHQCDGRRRLSRPHRQAPADENAGRCRRHRRGRARHGGASGAGAIEPGGAARQPARRVRLRRGRRGRRRLRDGASLVAERPGQCAGDRGWRHQSRQEKIYNPAVYTRNFGSDTDWGYKSTPQQALNNRVIVAPVGKIIGGGSSINATVWLKGDKADYDAWEAAAGPAWSYEAIIRNFKKTERFAGGATAIRGGDGMIATRKPALAHPVTHAFVASAVGLGKSEHMDINNIASVGDAAGQQESTST
jgi:choline dehydrogenase-like flavoprotein